MNIRLIAEGANGPTSPEGCKILRDKNVDVLPDILCNAGGVTVSYFEWTRNLSHMRFGRLQRRYDDPGLPWEWYLEAAEKDRLAHQQQDALNKKINNLLAAPGFEAYAR